MTVLARRRSTTGCATAWVFAVTSQQYTVGIPGTVVHALVDPRRGALLEIRPLLADAPD